MNFTAMQGSGHQRAVGAGALKQVEKIALLAGAARGHQPAGEMPAHGGQLLPVIDAANHVMRHAVENDFTSAATFNLAYTIIHGLVSIASWHRDVRYQA